MRFTVVACTRTTTSPLAGTGAGTSSKRTTSGPPYSVRTAARTFSVWPRHRCLLGEHIPRALRSAPALDSLRGGAAHHQLGRRRSGHSVPTVPRQAHCALLHGGRAMGSLVRSFRGLAAGSLAAVLLISGGALAAPPAGPRYTAGAEGAGDSYFPLAGNGGYDVTHYDLAIDYTPPVATVPATPIAQIRGQLQGVATIDLVATQDLDRFNLDLRGMDVTAMTINGKRATGVAAARCRGRGGRCGVLAGPGRRRPEVGAHRPAATEAQDRPVGPGRRHLRRRDRASHRHRRSALRLGHHARRCDGGERARGVHDVVPGQRPPDGQGHLQLRDHRARGQDGGGQRPPGTGTRSRSNGRTTWFWDAPDLQASYLTTASVGDFVQRPMTTSASGVPILDFVDSKLTT